MTYELSRQEIQAEIEEKKLDLEAFVKARELVRKRVQEVRDHPTAHLLTSIDDWSGTDAVLGSMDLAIHAMERTIEELRQVDKALSLGRKFRVVEGEVHGSES